MRQLLQQVSRRRVRLVVLLRHLSVRQRALVVLRVVLLVDSRARPLGNELQRGVTDGNGEAKREIKHAALAAVLEACARETDLTAQPVSKSVFATRWWGGMENGGGQTFVFLNRLVRSAAQRNTVNGRVQILHSMPRSSLIIWMNGLSVAERQSLQTAGKSETSAPLRFMSDLGPAGGIVVGYGGLFEVVVRWR